MKSHKSQPISISEMVILNNKFIAEQRVDRLKWINESLIQPFRFISFNTPQRGTWIINGPHSLYYFHCHQPINLKIDFKREGKYFMCGDWWVYNCGQYVDWWTKEKKTVIFEFPIENYQFDEWLQVTSDIKWINYAQTDGLKDKINQKCRFEIYIFLFIG